MVVGTIFPFNQQESEGAWLERTYPWSTGRRVAKPENDDREERNAVFQPIARIARMLADRHMVRQGCVGIHRIAWTKIQSDL